MKIWYYIKAFRVLQKRLCVFSGIQQLYVLGTYIYMYWCGFLLRLFSFECIFGIIPTCICLQNIYSSFTQFYFYISKLYFYGLSTNKIHIAVHCTYYFIYFRTYSEYFYDSEHLNADIRNQIIKKNGRLWTFIKWNNIEIFVVLFLLRTQ